MDLEEILRRGVAEIVVEEEFRQKLRAGRRLRIKQGFDPSRPDLHLGHAVGLRKLRQLQELGHQVVLIVGDWTAQIGDPSGASATRLMLSLEEVKANAQTYLKQFFRIVDPAKTEVRWQSEWYKSFDLADVLRLASRFTVAQLMAREDFAQRSEAGSPISLTELLYPLLQAHDSVAIEADVELGGLDQKFNCLMGRALQRMMGQRPQDVLLVPLLVGTDGVLKMSKSYDNYIALTDPPKEMYGKVMSLPDQTMLTYLECLTDVPWAEVEGLAADLREGHLNPRDVKMRLARELVAQFHNAATAQAAEAEFRRVFQERGLPSEIPEFPLVSRASESWPDALINVLAASGTVASKSEAKRLYAGGSIDLSIGLTGDWVDARQCAGATALQPGTIIRVGKRRFLRLTAPTNSARVARGDERS